MMMVGCKSGNTDGSAVKDGEAVVYITKDISPEGLVAIYKALGVEAAGRVAVKISTGEGGYSGQWLVVSGQCCRITGY